MKPEFSSRPFRTIRLGENVAVIFLLTVSRLADGAEPGEDHPRPAEKQVYHVPAKVFAAVTATLPKFSAVLAAPAKPAPVTEAPGGELLPDGTLRLPDFEVQEARRRIIPPESMLSEKGKLALALKKFPGLGFGPLAFLNGGLSLEMLREEEEAATRVALADEVARTTQATGAGSKEAADLTRKAIELPNNDWQTRSAGGSLK